MGRLTGQGLSSTPGAICVVGGVVPLWVVLRAKGGAVRLYARLTYVSAEGKEPAEHDLAADLGVSVHTIQRWMNELVSIGALRVRRRGRSLSNLYELRTEPPQ